MTRITDLFIAGAGLASILPAKAAASERKSNDEQKPNILFILADDLGYGDLGCYGNEVIKTPVIDGLADEGMRFTDFYAGASVSSPSRCCLMTGMNTGHSRIRGNTCKTGGLEGDREGMGRVRRTSIQPEDLTIASVLHNQGYRTCLVNKWHLDGFDSKSGPLDRGFDEFYGWLIGEPRSQNYYPDVRWRNRERYEIDANKDGRHGDHNTDRSTDEAIDFLKRMAGKKDSATAVNGNQPFFLYLAYNSPHVPLDARSRKLYENSGLPLTDQSYASLVSQMDECIGRVLETLKALGIENNTIVIFASDNGGAKAAMVEKLKLNGKLRGWKGDLYEGGLRVPVIVRWPGRIKAGSVSAAPCYFSDFFSTFADISGAGKQKTDGIDLLPLFTGKSKKIPERFLYWEQFPRKGISQAVRFGNWKAIRMQQNEPWQLYNLKDDVSETKDLAKDYPGIISRINKYMKTARTDSECWPVD